MVVLVVLDDVATFPDIGVEGARCVPAGLRGTLLVGVVGIIFKD